MKKWGSANQLQQRRHPLKLDGYLSGQWGPLYTDSAIVEFAASVQGLARVHQYGLRDRVSRHGPEVQYPARELLGISDEDAELIEMMVIEVLADLRL